MKMWTLGADVVREVRDALPIPMMTDAESIVLVVDGEEHAIKGTLPRPRDGERVTAADVAEVLRLEHVRDNGLSVRARSEAGDMLDVLLLNIGPRLAREVERLTAERATIDHALTEAGIVAARTTLDRVQRVIADANGEAERTLKAEQESERLTAERDALREKARAVLAVREGAASSVLIDALTQLAAEVDPPKPEPTREENFAALKSMYPRLAAVYEEIGARDGVKPWEVSDDAFEAELDRRRAERGTP